jgi:hypothetical protein
VAGPFASFATTWRRDANDFARLLETVPRFYRRQIPQQGIYIYLLPVMQWQDRAAKKPNQEKRNKCFEMVQSVTKQYCRIIQVLLEFLPATSVEGSDAKWIGTGLARSKVLFQARSADDPPPLPFRPADTTLSVTNEQTSVSSSQLSLNAVSLSPKSPSPVLTESDLVQRRRRFLMMLRASMVPYGLKFLPKFMIQLTSTARQCLKTMPQARIDSIVFEMLDEVKHIIVDAICLHWTQGKLPVYINLIYFV